MRVAKPIELDAQTQRELWVLSQRKRIEVRLQQRARIVLLAAQGLQNKDIAAEVGFAYRVLTTPTPVRRRVRCGAIAIH